MNEEDSKKMEIVIRLFHNLSLEQLQEIDKFLNTTKEKDGK